MGGTIVGLIAIGIGTGLYFGSRSSRNKGLEVRYIQTSAISQVNENFATISPEIGAGNYSEFVELKGEALPDPSLRAEHTGTTCVWYRATVTREYEEKVQKKEPDGSTREETKSGSETVATKTDSARFSLSDSTGTVTVYPEGAEIGAKTTLDERRPTGPHGVADGGGSRRTLGYHYREEIIPIGQRLYVLGEATDRGGSLAIQKSHEKDKPFIISIKSEEQVSNDLTGSASFMRWAAIVFFVVGALAIVWGILG